MLDQFLKWFPILGIPIFAVLGWLIKRMIARWDKQQDTVADALAAITKENEKRFDALDADVGKLRTNIERDLGTLRTKIEKDLGDLNTLLATTSTEVRLRAQIAEERSAVVVDRFEAVSRRNEVIESKAESARLEVQRLADVVRVLELTRPSRS